MRVRTRAHAELQDVTAGAQPPERYALYFAVAVVGDDVEARHHGAIDAHGDARAAVGRRGLPRPLARQPRHQRRRVGRAREREPVLEPAVARAVGMALWALAPGAEPLPAAGGE